MAEQRKVDRSAEKNKRTKPQEPTPPAAAPESKEKAPERAAEEDLLKQRLEELGYL